MKIAVMGATLQAGVMTSILSEYGNEVYFYPGSDGFLLDGGHIHEPHLSRRLQQQYADGSFHLVQAQDLLPLQEIECFFFCYDPLSFDEAKSFVKALPAHRLGKKRLMINSGTFGLHGTERLQDFLPAEYWSYLPDTIQEGNALNSFTASQKLILGVEDDAAKVLLKELFRPLFPLERQYLWMPIIDAELVKMSISGMLATRISYMNDLANLAEKLGVDILNIKEGLATDNRIGGSYLSPGVGFGGENFSHDILMLSNLVSKSGVSGRLLEQVWEINEAQKEILFRKLWAFYDTNLSYKKVAIWGVTFKEGTSSIYNSPIHKMILALLAQGAKISLYDPEGLPMIMELYDTQVKGGDISICHTKYEALTHADALCVLTPWKEFYSPDYERMRALMTTLLILDGRNIYDPQFMRQAGFIYEGVGR